MKKKLSTAFLLIGMFALGLFSVPQARSVTLLNEEGKIVDLFLRHQLFGTAEIVPDPVRDDKRLYLFLKQARLGINGEIEGHRFGFEVAFAGEGEVKAPNPGVALNLLSLWVDQSVGENTFVRVGQFKIPYSRERLASSGDLSFADRSLVNLFFRMGYDVGAAVGGKNFALGAFVGGGRDVPERYLAETLGLPLVVLRVGVQNGAQADIWDVRPAKYPKEPLRAFYVNALYMRDTLIGHSSTLSLKLSERSILLNNNWNPFLKPDPNRVEFWQIGADFVVETGSENRLVRLEGEGHLGSLSGSSGTVHAGGGLIQAAFYRAPVEWALRYAAVIGDESMAVYKGSSVLGNRTFHEITPAFTYFLNPHAKIIIDAPIFLRAPVVVSPLDNGSYVAWEQPDQVTYLTKAGAKLEYRDIPHARLLLQFEI